MNQEYSRLFQHLGHRFSHMGYLTTALTHRSAGNPNNERLEFLGDAILNYVVAEILFERFPNASEGELTRLRANLVKGDTLAEIARKMDLGQFLRLGGGEMKTGGWHRSSILSDALEALIGAVYLDAGMEKCKKILRSLLGEMLQSQSPNTLLKDSKTRLQEYLQAKRMALPSYRVLSVGGAAHEQHFAVECVVQALPQPTYGEGKSRRFAEQEAAEKALAQLTND